MSARLLVVEDHPDLQRALVLRLSSAGYDVHTASTADEAIASAWRLLPDLIVLDLGLPDASGHVVASQLRNDGRARFPIVVLSGKSCASERAMAGQLGAAAYLLKPYDPGELLRVIATLVRGLDRQAEAAGPPFASPSMLPAQLAPVPANERCRP